MEAHSIILPCSWCCDIHRDHCNRWDTTYDYMQDRWIPWSMCRYQKIDHMSLCSNIPHTHGQWSLRLVRLPKRVQLHNDIILNNSSTNVTLYYSRITRTNTRAAIGWNIKSYIRRSTPTFKTRASARRIRALSMSIAVVQHRTVRQTSEPMRDENKRKKN